MYRMVLQGLNDDESYADIKKSIEEKFAWYEKNRGIAAYCEQQMMGITPAAKNKTNKRKRSQQATQSADGDPVTKQSPAA